MDKLCTLFIENLSLSKAEAEAFCLFQRYGSITPLTKDFFTDFFTKYLPRTVCMADSRVIDSLYPVLYRFCIFCTAMGEQTPLMAMEAVPVGVLSDFARLLKAKAALLRFIESPILCRDPLIVDLAAYARKKQERPRAKGPAESGLYEVAELFGRDSLVLRRISPSPYYLRLYLTREIVGCLQKGDVLRLTLRERGFLSGWIIEDVGELSAPPLLEVMV